jgi:hypothetical protein
MTEARIGRLLGASLHEAIGDVLPQRLEFYEHWLHSEGLRDGAIGPAQLTAVLGFLRTEGRAYEAVMVRAGELAAQWSVQSMPAFRRRTIGWLPRPLRTRAALRLAGRIVRSVSSRSRASSRVRRQHARIKVASSIFCTVRDTSDAPLCGFYIGVATGTLAEFGITASGRVEACRAQGGTTCEIVLEINAAGAAGGSAAAA